MEGIEGRGRGGGIVGASVPPASEGGAEVILIEGVELAQVRPRPASPGSNANKQASREYFELNVAGCVNMSGSRRRSAEAASLPLETDLGRG